MTRPLWLSRIQVEAIHDDQLHEHGGLAGLRDPGALEAALARPLNTFLHSKCDLADLAALYAHGIVKNHPFNDGNKRTAFAVAAVFLDINRVEISLSEPEAALRMLELTDSSITEKQFAEFLRKNSKRMKRK
jgi:death-on-curing protein